MVLVLSVWNLFLHYKFHLFQEPILFTATLYISLFVHKTFNNNIVKAHGGEIKVGTKEGDGSEFIIQLPL
jgi:hypothetical protein